MGIYQMRMRRDVYVTESVVGLRDPRLEALKKVFAGIAFTKKDKDCVVSDNLDIIPADADIVLPSKVYRLRIVSVLFPLPEARTIGER